MSMAKVYRLGPRHRSHTDTGDTDDQQKGLIDVVNTLVFQQDMGSDVS